MTSHVVVIGAGIVGTCCALWIRRQGFRVTLVDRNEPGSGCSSGNAGMFQTGSVAPLATPGILRRVPRMLLDRNGPLVIRWKHLPVLVPWLWRLVRNASPARMEAIAGALASLLHGAMEAYRPLIVGAAAQSLIRDLGELYVFRSDRAYAAVAQRHLLYRRHGIDFVELDAASLREREPALSGDYRRGYYLPDSSYTTNPHGLTLTLVSDFARRGGEVLRVDASEIAADGCGVRITTSGATLPCDRLVIAAGAYSKSLAAQVGVDVPLESLRGYHLDLPGRGVQLNGPLIDGEMNFGVIPMASELRLAGTIEFAGLEAAPVWQRAEMLLPLAKAMLPSLASDGKDAVRWMGHRPGLPDSLPVIGPAPSRPNVWLAFGHGQLGLTLAAVTGRVVAEALAGRPTTVDLSPFRADRFALA
jgi:glycine/D-amino acid oxidase-like deaminating enzyme